MSGVSESYFKLNAGNTVPPAVSALSTPNHWTEGDESEVKCYNCNKTGHMSKACSEAKKELLCWRCGTTGHIVNDCKVTNHKVTGAPCLLIVDVYK